MVQLIQPTSVARRIAWGLTSLAALLAAGSPASAMRVSPMVAEVTTTGAGSAARIEIGNEAASPLPYETKVWLLDFDETGKVTQKPAEDDFLIFPPQSVVPATSRQVVRVQWVGDPELKTSRAYYIEIDQLPVDLAAGPTNNAAAAVQVVYHMKALVTVAPPNAQSKVSVVSAIPGVDTPAPPANIAPELQGKPPANPPPPPAPIPVVRIKLRNDGARHALMGGVNWILDGADTSGKPLHYEIKADKVGAAIGVGYLPPAGGARVFTIPVDTAFGPQPIKVRFTE